MASSAKFLEEALSTDVDESAVSAIVGSLENQLGTPSPSVSCQQVSSNALNQNHLQSGVSNANPASLQNHGTTNGRSDNTMSITLNSEPNKDITSGGGHQQIVQSSTANIVKTQDGIKTVYASNQSATNVVGATRVTYPLQNVNSLPNGNLNVASLPANSVLNVSSANLQGTAVIIKSNACNNVQSSTVPSQMTTAISLSGSQLNTTAVTLARTTAGGAPTIVSSTPQTILSNVQVVNLNAVRAGTPTQTVNRPNAPPRLMIPQMIGARPGQPGQITIQALQGLQGAQGGHLLLKTENGAYQLLRVGPPTPQGTTVGQNATTATIPQSFRIQTVPVCAATSATPSPTVQTVTSQNQIQTGSPAQRNNDNNKEKCRRFLTNLLELSSREPKAVEKNVRTLIQELIDSMVEPEEFCDRLEKLLNASPQPCLIGFLKKSLPLLRAAMIAKELTIEGIRAPAPTQSQTTVVLAAAPPNVVQAQLQNNQVRPIQVGMQQVRMIPQSPMTTTTRPQQAIQQRLITQPVVRVATAGNVAGGGGVKITTQTIPTVATTVRIPQLPVTSVALSGSIGDSTSTTSTGLTLVSSANSTASLATATTTAIIGQNTVRVQTPIRHTIAKNMPIKTNAAASPTVRGANAMSNSSSAQKTQTVIGTKNNFISKSPMLSGIGKQQITSSQAKSAAKDKEKKSVATAAAAAAAAATSVTALAGGYVGDDDVNDVAAMAGVNLAEETQRILGPSEFVGTQIRSCKDETFLHTHPLTMRIIEIAAKHGLDEPTSDVVALISHAAQERLKNIVEKLNVIAEHRVDFNKADKNYEISHDIRGQLRCLEELDKVERKRHDEMERELLLRAAKSRSKSEDPEQVKLKAKAKELQRAEMEELRQREANLTALQAIGPRKKIKLEGTDGQGSFNFSGSSNLNSGTSRLPLANRPRLKRVTVRDFLYVMEKEKHINRSPFLYKSYLK
ncbi:transcription initiation factor TFIID subunit 4 isoform X2 [Planococcus citri]|uniref:transcription initiation factor TFIID subunit 4 isoform X2 n=1 Tax=Planococcus citri TaxID=170843 RepID=UPI0031F78B22